MDFSSLFKGKYKIGKTIGGTLAGFGVIAIPHELIHAKVNELTGGGVERIVLNRFYGGDLVHLISPDIEVKWMFPLIGGYVQPSSYASDLSHFTMAVAPYILTPIGIYI